MSLLKLKVLIQPINIVKQLVVERFISYKSSLSLEKLYPERLPKLDNLNLEKKYAKDGFIPLEQLVITYSKSSGPGGQNVNKINTKVDVRFHLDSVKWINEDVKKTLHNQMKSRITKDGYLVFKSDLTRYQQLNLADCLEKLRNTLRNAALCNADKIISPETEEKIRQRREAAKRQNLMMKRHRSEIKRNRQDPTVNDL